MDPAEPQPAASDQDQGTPERNGAQAAPGAAAGASEPPAGYRPEPPAPAAQPGETAELEALRLARLANETAGGLVARLDQIETKVGRVDRQVLMVIGMIAVLTWSVKVLGGKLEGLSDAAAPTT